MAEARSPLLKQKNTLGLPEAPTGYRSRSSSIVWIDMLTKEQPNSEDDERRMSVPVYNDWEDP